MNHEDLFRAIGETDDAMLEDAAIWASAAKRKRWNKIGALAACLCLVVAGAVIYKPWSIPRHVEAPSIIEETPAPQQDVIPPVQPDPAPSYTMPTLSFTQEDELAYYDIGYPPGYFQYDLTQAQIAEIWGLEALHWEDFVPEAQAMTGNVVYHHDGTVWMVQLRYQVNEAQTVTVALSPETLPPTCMFFDNATELTLEGYVPAKITATEAGDYRRVTFLRGEGEEAVGVMIEGYAGVSEELLTRIVGQSLRKDGILQVRQLTTTEIPDWRSEALTEEQARAEEGIGTYLPASLPDGYRFESAYREVGQDRDWLSVQYTNAQGGLTLTLYPHGAVSGLVHADETEKYDLSYFGEKPDVPEELYDSWLCPTFYARELTMEVIHRRVWRMHTGEARVNFAVLYDDGTVLTVNLFANPEDIPQALDFLFQ